MHGRELRSLITRISGALLVACLAHGCFLDRSGTARPDGSTPRVDAGPRADAARADAGYDASVDSAVPIEDGCVPSVETCNGLDDDCDGVIDDALSRTCATACGTGTETCTLGRWDGCTAPAPTAETCDNVDNDCNGLIDDMLTRSCTNDCGVGTERCMGGAWGACSTPPPGPEICDNFDNDCDGMTDEGVSISCNVMTACGSITGTSVCVGGSYGPCDAAAPVEVCNGLDDDCDTVIDNGAGCPCTLRHLRGHAYLFCTSRVSWSDAEAACRANGYELITIDDGEENTFARQGLGMDLDDDWWIGLNDRSDEGTWRWSYGSSSYDGWAGGEPGSFDARSRDCVVIENGSSGWEDYGEWADHACGEDNPYVCESR